MADGTIHGIGDHHGHGAGVHLGLGDPHGLGAGAVLLGDLGPDGEDLTEHGIPVEIVRSILVLVGLVIIVIQPRHVREVL